MNFLIFKGIFNLSSIDFKILGHTLSNADFISIITPHTDSFSLNAELIFVTNLDRANEHDLAFLKPYSVYLE